MIRRYKYLALVLAVAMMIGAFGACGDSNVENLANEAGTYSFIGGTKSLTDKLTLAWSPKNLRDEYYAKVTQGFEDYCEEKKYTALVANPKNKREEQYSEFENWIAMGVDGIAASPVDAQRLGEVVQIAKEEGIVVAGFFDEIPLANISFVVDEYACGVIIGENAARWIDEKVVGAANVFILGNDADEGMLLRRKGMQSVLEDTDAVHVVSCKNAQTIDEARKAATTVLNMYKNINVVICVSDEFALAVLEVTEDPRIGNENYYIGGAGYTLEAIESMNEGKAGSFLRSTVDFDPYLAGRQIAQMLADAIVNGSYAKTEYMSMNSYWQNLLGWE